METALYLNRDRRKWRINLFEARLVKAAVLAANPKTESELDQSLAAIRAYGPLVGRCLEDETEALREPLFESLILPRLTSQPRLQLA